MTASPGKSSNRLKREIWTWAGVRTRIAQVAERRARNPEVRGSSPGSGSSFLLRSYNVKFPKVQTMGLVSINNLIWIYLFFFFTFPCCLSASVYLYISYNGLYPVTLPWVFLIIFLFLLHSSNSFLGLPRLLLPSNTCFVFPSLLILIKSGYQGLEFVTQN